jgi:hypothetical protein
VRRYLDINDSRCLALQAAFLEETFARILASDAPRAVFLLDGVIVSCPSGGQTGGPLAATPRGGLRGHL